MFTSYPCVLPQEMGDYNSMTGSIRGLFWFKCAMPHRLKCLSTSSPVGDAGFEGNGTFLGSGALLGVVGHGPQDLTARAQFLSSSLPSVQLPHIPAATPSPLS